MPYHVYVLTKTRRGTLYTGVTNNLERRMAQHQTGKGSKFVQHYRLSRLLYAEEFRDIREAISVEKRFKRWKRSWKFAAIEKIIRSGVTYAPDERPSLAQGNIRSRIGSLRSPSGMTRKRESEFSSSIAGIF